MKSEPGCHWACEADIASPGVGICNSSGYGLAVGTKLLDGCISFPITEGFGGDMSVLPLYMHMFKGIPALNRRLTNGYCIFGSVNAWICGVPTEADLDMIVRAGIGVRWHYTPASFGIESVWRRDYTTYPSHVDVLDLMIGIELSGWWKIH